MSFIPLDSDDEGEYQINARRYGTITAEDDDDVGELGVLTLEQLTSFSSNYSSSTSSSSSSSSSSDSDSDDDGDSSDDGREGLSTNMRLQQSPLTSTMTDTISNSTASTTTLSPTRSKPQHPKQFRVDHIPILRLTALFPNTNPSPPCETFDCNNEQNTSTNTQLSTFLTQTSTLRSQFLSQPTTINPTADVQILGKLRRDITHQLCKQHDMFSTPPFSPSQFYSFHWEYYLNELSLYTRIIALEQEYSYIYKEIESIVSPQQQSNKKTTKRDRNKKKDSNSGTTLENYATAVIVPTPPLSSQPPSLNSATLAKKDEYIELLSAIPTHITHFTNLISDNTSSLIQMTMELIQPLIISLTKTLATLSPLPRSSPQPPPTQPQYDHPETNTVSCAIYTGFKTAMDLIRSLLRIQSLQCLLALTNVIYHSHLIPLELQIPMDIVSIVIDSFQQRENDLQGQKNRHNIVGDDSNEQLERITTAVFQFLQKPQILPIILSTSRSMGSIYHTQTVVSNGEGKSVIYMKEGSNPNDLILSQPPLDPNNTHLTVDLVELLTEHFQTFYKAAYGVSALNQGYPASKVKEFILFYASHQPIFVNTVSYISKTHTNSVIQSHLNHFRQREHQLQRDGADKWKKNVSEKISFLNFKMTKGVKTSLTKPRFDGGFIQPVKVNSNIQCQMIREYYTSLKFNQWREVITLADHIATTQQALPHLLTSTNPYTTLLFARDSSNPYRFTQQSVGIIQDPQDQGHFGGKELHHKIDTSLSYNNTQHSHYPNQLLARYQHTNKVVNDLATYAAMIQPIVPNKSEFETMEREHGQLTNKDKQRGRNKDLNQENLEPNANSSQLKPLLPLENTILLSSQPLLSNAPTDLNNNILYTQHASLFSVPKDAFNLLKYYPRNQWLLSDLMRHSDLYSRGGVSIDDTTQQQSQLLQSQFDGTSPHLPPQFTLLHSLFDVEVYSQLLEQYHFNVQHLSPKTCVGHSHRHSLSPLDISLNLQYDKSTPDISKTNFYTLLSSFSSTPPTTTPFNQTPFPHYQTIDGLVTTPLHMLQLFSPLPDLGMVSSLTNQIIKANRQQYKSIQSAQKKGGDQLSSSSTMCDDDSHDVTAPNLDQSHDSNDTIIQKVEKSDGKQIKLSFQHQVLIYRTMLTVQNHSFCLFLLETQRSLHRNILSMTAVGITSDHSINKMHCFEVQTAIDTHFSPLKQIFSRVPVKPTSIHSTDLNHSVSTLKSAVFDNIIRTFWPQIDNNQQSSSVMVSDRASVLHNLIQVIVYKGFFPTHDINYHSTKDPIVPTLVTTLSELNQSLTYQLDSYTTTHIATPITNLLNLHPQQQQQQQQLPFNISIESVPLLQFLDHMLNNISTTAAITAFRNLTLYFTQQLMILTQSYISTLQQQLPHSQTHIQQHQLYLVLLTSSIVTKLFCLGNYSSNEEEHQSQSEQISVLETHFSVQLTYLIDSILFATPLPDVHSITPEETTNLYTSSPNTTFSTVLVTTLHFWRTITLNLKDQFATKLPSSHPLAPPTRYPLLTALNTAVMLLLFYSLLNTNQNNVVAFFMKPQFRPQSTHNGAILSSPTASTSIPFQVISQSTSNMQLDGQPMISIDPDNTSLQSDNLNNLYQSYKNNKNVYNSTLLSSLPPLPHSISLTTPGLIPALSNTNSLKHDNWLCVLFDWLKITPHIFSLLLVQKKTLHLPKSQSHLLSLFFSITAHSIALSQHAIILALSQVYLAVCRDAITTIMKGPQNVKPWDGVQQVHQTPSTISHDYDLPSDETYTEALSHIQSDIQTTYTVPKGLVTTAGIILSLLLAKIGLDYSRSTSTNPNSQHDSDNTQAPVLPDLRTLHAIVDYTNPYIGIFAPLAIYLDLPRQFIEFNSHLIPPSPISGDNTGADKDTTTNNALTNAIVQCSLLSSIPNAFLSKPEHQQEIDPTAPPAASSENETQMTNNDSDMDGHRTKQLSYVNSLSLFVQFVKELSATWTTTFLATPLQDYIIDVETKQSIGSPTQPMPLQCHTTTQTTPHRLILSILMAISELFDPNAVFYPQVYPTTPTQLLPTATNSTNPNPNNSQSFQPFSSSRAIINNTPIQDYYSLNFSDSQPTSRITQGTISAFLDPFSVSISSEVNYNLPLHLSSGNNQLNIPTTKELAQGSVNLTPIPVQFINTTNQYLRTQAHCSILLRIISGLDIMNRLNSFNSALPPTYTSNNANLDTDTTPVQENVAHLTETNPFLTLSTFSYHQLQTLLPILASFTNLYTLPQHVISPTKPFAVTWCNQIDVHLAFLEKKQRFKVNQEKSGGGGNNSSAPLSKRVLLYKIKQIEGRLAGTPRSNTSSSKDAGSVRRVNGKLKQKLEAELAQYYDELARVDPGYHQNKRSRDSLHGDHGHGDNNAEHIDQVQDFKGGEIGPSESHSNGANTISHVPKQQRHNNTLQFTDTEIDSGMIGNDEVVTNPQTTSTNQPEHRFLPDSHIVYVSYLPQFTQEHLTAITNFQEERFQNENDNPRSAPISGSNLVSLDNGSQLINGVRDVANVDVLKTLQEQIADHCKARLSTLFSQYGQIHLISLPLDPTTKLPRGNCKIIYEEERSANCVISELKKIKVRFEFENVKVSTTAKCQHYVAHVKHQHPQRHQHHQDPQNHQQNHQQQSRSGNQYHHKQHGNSHHDSSQRDRAGTTINDTAMGDGDDHSSKPSHANNKQYHHNHHHSNDSYCDNNNNNNQRYNNANIRHNYRNNRPTENTNGDDDYYLTSMKQRQNQHHPPGPSTESSTLPTNLSTSTPVNQDTLENKATQKTAEEKRRARNAILGIKD